MATYVIGDVQGCYSSLLGLLDLIAYEPEKDKLWFAGDLVNRGPDSLRSLRLIREIATKVTLGNHDLHLLACFYGTRNKPRSKDTFQDILEAPDCPELLEWLRNQPLMVKSKKRRVTLSHAGIPHIWSVDKAYALSKEVSKILKGHAAPAFFDAMYGNEPKVWDDSLEGLERSRVITNYLTRMRFVTAKGALEFSAKESVASAPEGFRPWFEFPRKSADYAHFFGHWAALGGETGIDGIYATDTGCVWGGALSAINLKTRERYSVPCVRE